MSTLAPDRIELDPEPQIARQEPGWPGRVACWLRGDSNSRVWVRRKMVAAWMNILIAAVAAVTVVIAGRLAGPHWPPPQTWGPGAPQLFPPGCLAFLPGRLYLPLL